MKKAPLMTRCCEASGCGKSGLQLLPLRNVVRCVYSDRWQPTSAASVRFFLVQAADQFTMPLYAVASTTRPNAMRYQANALKSWRLM